MIPITFERSPLSGGSHSQQVKFSGGLSAVTLGDGYTSGWLSIRFLAGSRLASLTAAYILNSLKN